MAPARSSRAANDKLTTAGSSSQRVMQCWLDLVPEESDQKGEITVCFLILIGWSGIPWHVHVPLDQTGQCPSCKTPRHLSRQFAERASFSFCQCLHQVSLEACSNNSGKSSARTMLSSRTLSACTRCHAPFVCMCPERITFILATALWISGSVLMYYAERDNPDEGSHTASRCTFLARSVLRADRLGERLRYSGSFPHAVSFLLDDWTGLHQRSSRERPFCPGACLQFGNNRASRVQVPTNPRGRPFTRSSCWWVSV